MGDEWVCKECGRSAMGNASGEKCPDCGGEIINIGDVDEDLKPKDNSAKYDEDDLETPIEREIDLDFQE